MAELMTESVKSGVVIGVVDRRRLGRGHALRKGLDMDAKI
jgi:hypothetical protein